MTSFPLQESRLTTWDVLIALFSHVDEPLHDLPKHPEAPLWPREVVTLGRRHALKGVGTRAFHRWLTRAYRTLFPRLPEPTRLFRLVKTPQAWTQVCLAAPTVLGGSDPYGIALIHPIREGRSPQQIGRKGLSNHRWLGGGKLCLFLHQYGRVVGWDWGAATGADTTFQGLMRQVDGRLIVLSDPAFHAAAGAPAHLKLCQRGAWEERMVVETVLSMRTLVCPFKQVMHRVWEYWQARLAFTMAAFNGLGRGMASAPTRRALCPSRSLS